MSTVRSLVYTALTTDATLQSLGITADSTYAAGSLDGPAPTPFMVIRWGGTTRGIGPINAAPVTLYVHDDHGDYGAIVGILQRARAVMTALSASGPSANWIIDVRWNGDSEDLSDDGYKTLMRNATFEVVANTL